MPDLPSATDLPSAPPALPDQSCDLEVASSGRSSMPVGAAPAPAPAADGRKPPLLILATPDWDGTYMKSTVALAGELAAHYQVLYVEHPPTHLSTARDVAAGRKSPSEIVRRAPRVRRVQARCGTSVDVLTPPSVWPLNRLPRRLYEPVLARNARRVRDAVQPWLDRLGMQSPLVLNALNPHYGVALADAFDEVGRVYYCYDEVRARDWNGRHGGRMEERYLEMVGAAIGSSPALHARLKTQTETAFLVPNGVDFSLFHRAFPAGAPTGQAPTAGGESGPSPCFGYVGSLDERVDYRLLHRLAERRPDAHLRLVGRIVDPQARALERHPNVTLTGPKSPDDLPAELRAMDVGLIPFVRDAFTRCIYPLKANEYLAAGLPVVSTAFADLSLLQPVVTVAQTAGQFLEAVREVLRPHQTSGAERRRRARVAASNRWSVRAEKVRAVLERVRAGTP